MPQTPYDELLELAAEMIGYVPDYFCNKWDFTPRLEHLRHPPADQSIWIVVLTVDLLRTDIVACKTAEQADELVRKLSQQFGRKAVTMSKVVVGQEPAFYGLTEPTAPPSEPSA